MHRNTYHTYQMYKNIFFLLNQIKKKIEHQRLQEVHWLVRDAAAIPSYKPFSNCFKYIDIEWYLCGFILISCFMTNQIVRLYQ